MKLSITFAENAQDFSVSFGELFVVEKTDIPKEYGLITYTQDKIITVT